MKLTHLSLFSGIGGLDLAAEWAGIQAVGQCEWAEYPTKVLERHWPDVQKWKDIRTLTGESFYERTGRRTVDVISGGFPCQPFSVAGKQRGKEDDRYLWPEMVRVIKELRPTWVIGENVAGIVRMALADILSELEACGYRTRAFLIPACAVGARHRRYRVAIVAHSDRSGQLYRQNKIKPAKGREQERKKEAGFIGGGEDVQHPNGTGRKEQHTAAESDKKRFAGWGCDAGASILSNTNNGFSECKNEKIQPGSDTAYCSGTGKRKRSAESVLGGVADGISSGLDRDLDFIIDYYWDIEPDIPRIATGVEHRVDRLKCLGNAVVPQQFYPVFEAIAKVEELN